MGNESDGDTINNGIDTSAEGNTSGSKTDETPFVDGKLYTDEYDANALFRFGMIPAECDNGKWGYLNKNGDWAIAPQFK